MNNKDDNSSKQLNELTNDVETSLNRALTQSVMDNFIQTDKNIEPLKNLFNIHLKIKDIERKIGSVEGLQVSNDSILELKAEINQCHQERNHIIDEFNNAFQYPEQKSSGRLYSQTPGEICDRLIALIAGIDQAILIQNDTSVPDLDRMACMDEVDRAFELKTHLQNCLKGMLDDFNNHNAVFPKRSELTVYQKANINQEQLIKPNGGGKETTPKPVKTDKDIKHILGLACTGHGASITYLGNDGTLRSSVFDRWRGTKYTFLMTQDEIDTLLEKRSPLAAEMHELLELSYGRFPRHRAFETDFTDWLNWLLKDLDLTAEDIDLFISSDCLFVTSKFGLRDELDKWFPNAEIVTDVEHHTIHQRQAFWQSGFDEAAIVTLDTCGEDLGRIGVRKIGGTIAHMDKNGNCRVLKEFLFPRASSGIIYAVANHHIGFAQGQEGKTMGLAPYGKPDLYNRLVKNLQLYPDGGFDFISNQELHKALEEYEFERSRERDAEFTQKHMDIAYAAQTLVEDIISNSFKAALRLSGSKNIVFAGGVALNSVANEVGYRAAMPENIYIPPNPSDAGQALGFALYAAYEVAGWEPTGKEIPEYLGPTYTKEEVEKAANTTKYHAVHVEDAIQVAAKCMANGHIISRFSGSAEFGPRALGNRSILADPRRDDMKDYLNSRVKHREGFRPFAPTVLEEHVSDWFELNGRSPYMLRVVHVPEDIQKKIPAIVHVDGTARVQTVNQNENPGYWELIHTFYEMTGVPVVLNTSFNVGGKPIAETPQDAVDCFESTNIDVLLLEDWIISKRPLEEFTEVSR